jgi:hypothetical protein
VTSSEPINWTKKHRCHWKVVGHLLRRSCVVRERARWEVVARESGLFVVEGVVPWWWEE